MHRTVLSAIHLLHVENPLLVVRELIGLMREQSEMSEFGHGRSSLVFCQLSPLATIGVGGC